MREGSSANEYIFGLVAYLLSSARGCFDEPPHYGPLRLVEAVSRLVLLPKYADCIKEDPFLLEIKHRIDKDKHLGLVSEQQFMQLLDELVKLCAQEVKKRGMFE